MKVAFIYASSSREHYRSPETGCMRMAKLIPSSICLHDDLTNYEELRDLGYTIFCYGHLPRLYKNRKFVKGCWNDVINVRENWINCSIGIKCQSGFSYLKKRASKYQCFFPTVTTYVRKKSPKETCIGYYSRSVRRDTDLEFIKFANDVPESIPIIIMGEKIPLRRKYTYTVNEDEFFSLCTHYFYMKSLIREDPFPHTLLQACQSGCTLLMPDTRREWKDGIDDILNVCDVSPINTFSFKYPWEKESPCLYAPKGEDFLKLYQEIASCWNWIPDKMKTFGDVLNYAKKL